MLLGYAKQGYVAFLLRPQNVTCNLKMMIFKRNPFPGADFQVPYPIGSMGLVYLPYIYHKNQPNVGKYKIYPGILWVLNFRGVESQNINAPLLRQRGWPLKVFRVARSS